MAFVLCFILVGFALTTRLVSAAVARRVSYVVFVPPISQILANQGKKGCARRAYNVHRRLYLILLQM